MQTLSANILIITLNVNGLSKSIKNIKKCDPAIYCLQETHFKSNDILLLKVNG